MKNSKIGLFALAIVFATASAFAVKGQPKVFAKINGVCQEISNCTLQNVGQPLCNIVVDNNQFFPSIACASGQQLPAYIRVNQ